MANITISLPDGSTKELEQGATVYDVAASIGAGLAKAALAGKIDGMPVDITTPVPDGAAVEIITSKSPEALDILRHSAAHIMAQAIKRLHPDAQFGIGPSIEDGFYYDIEIGRPVTPEDLEEIEAEMGKIVKEDLPFTRCVVSAGEAMEKLPGQPLKDELISEMDADTVISLYTQGEFTDLCRGPHIPSTGKLPAFKLMKHAGAYWRGDSNRQMLQRIYGTAWFSKKDLEAYVTRLEEAAKRDHRKIGKEMELFMMAEEGPGFPFWLPNGMILKNSLMDYWHEMQAKYGYDEITTPIILNKSLWVTSGHWDHYKDNMYTTEIDGEEYAVKPMNCPGACLVYKSKPRSYRDLPLRLAEAGHDHRHELKGALHGLFRVRAFTQDDAHLFITPEQITEAVQDTAHLITAYYEQFGFPYHIELSTRPEDSMGSDEDWERAEAGLRTALDSMGVDYIVNEGDGAFYGPKIDFHLQDCLGRTWQCGTIQLDFQLPQNFELEYIDADDSRKRPIMVHRAGFGSFERFIGMLTEQYAGKFPTWLSPCQVKVLPVSEKTRDYSREVAAKLREAGIRVKLDERDEKIGYKIREAHAVDRVPYMLILGEKEVEAGNISVRDRSNKTVQRDLDEFIADVVAEIKERRG